MRLSGKSETGAEKRKSNTPSRWIVWRNITACIGNEQQLSPQTPGVHGNELPEKKAPGGLKSRISEQKIPELKTNTAGVI